MQGIDRFGIVRTPSAVATTTYEGGNAYELNDKELIAELFGLGLLEGTCYQSQEEVLKNAKGLMEKALAENPEFATKAAIYGSSFNSLKLIPTVWLVYLSTLPDKTLFKKAFSKIVYNPKMLFDFMELSRKGGIRQGLGSSVKKTINKWYENKLSDYFVCRYKQKLKDVVSVTRPKESANTKKYFDYLKKDKADGIERAVALKSVLSDLNSGVVNDDTLNKISTYKLQLEELKSAFGSITADQKKAIFMDMVKGLKYNALVSNLVTIERTFATRTTQTRKTNSHGSFMYTKVLETEIPEDLVNLVTAKLTNFEDYKRSRMLPFGLITANEEIIVTDWKNALSDVLKKSGEGLFNIPDNVGVRVGVDNSRSMMLPRMKITDSLYAGDIANIFGALIKLSVPHAEIFAVANRAQQVSFGGLKDLFRIAENIKNTPVGQATHFEPLLDNYNGEKYVILITDDQNADDLEAKWASLDKPQGAKLICWKLVPYGTKVSKRKDVTWLCGYSDNNLRLLRDIVEGKATQLSVIDSVEI